MAILYLDTSCLAKLFFDEPGSSRVAQDVASKIVATSVIAYPEMCSALARRRGEGGLTTAEFKEVFRKFRNRWPEFGAVHAEDRVISHAGDLAVLHKLRGMDAIHLASALRLKAKLRISEMEFLCADARLNRAAVREGLKAEFQNPSSGRSPV